MQRCFGFGGGERKNTLWPAVCFLEEPKSQLWASDILYISRISIPTPEMTSTPEGQPPKQGLFQSKQGSFGFYIYI